MLVDVLLTPVLLLNLQQSNTLKAFRDEMLFILHIIVGGIPKQEREIHEAKVAGQLGTGDLRAVTGNR